MFRISSCNFIGQSKYSSLKTVARFILENKSEAKIISVLTLQFAIQ